MPIRSRSHLFTGFGLALLAACGDGAGPERATIPSETFVSVYVELRAAAIEAERTAPTDGERAEILARHGVTEDDLVEFAEVHGRDLEFMADVWGEVEARLDTISLSPSGRR